MDPSVDPSDPKPLRLPNDLRDRMRAFCNSDVAIAILLAAGIAALFTTLTSHDANDHGERQTSAQTCDNDWCGDPVANAAPDSTIAETNIAETNIPQTNIPQTSIPETSVHLISIPRETPNIGRAQDEDRDRQPAPDTDRHHQPALNAKVYPPGIVASRKTGARAHVGVAYAARFQAYIDDLESNHGARIVFMGGIRPGHCASSSMHPCGKALDVCQLSRGVVDSRCHLPPRRTLAQIAASHGLFEGGRWCNSDYGHAQFGVTAADCGDRIARRPMAPEARRAAAFVSFE